MGSRNLAAAAACALLGALLGACERGTDGLFQATADPDPVVFLDTFGDGVGFQAFLDTKVDAVALDTQQRHRGTTSLCVTVPAPWDDTGLFAGGAFTASRDRDLSGYNALVFWAKADHDALLDVAGLGNDNTGTSLYQASRGAIPLTTDWTRVVIPIPLPARLAAERGLLFFAEGDETDQGYRFWVDEAKFEYDPAITRPRPTLLPATRTTFVGQSLSLEGTQTTFDVDGTDVLVEHMPGYFTFTSSDEDVAVVGDGEIRVVGPGTATVTARLGDVDAGGAVTLNASLPPAAPAPVPTWAAAEVISLFSDAYADRPVDTWSAAWDTADQFDLAIGGDGVKAYTGLWDGSAHYVAAEFGTSPIDASGMAYLHLDVFWSGDDPPPLGVRYVKVKLVDFGADGAYAGGDDSASNEVGIVIDQADQWTSLEIAFEEANGPPWFQGLTNRGHLAQLVLLGNPNILYVDNIYFHP